MMIKLRRTLSLLLFSIFSILSIPPAQAQDSFTVTQDVYRTELPEFPETLTFFLYEGEGATFPVFIQHFDWGQWQSNIDLNIIPLETTKVVQFRAVLTGVDQIPVHDMLWTEMMVNNKLVGTRTRLQALIVPGASFEGIVESRSITDGGFKYPDGSIQTTAGLPIGTTLSCVASNKMTGISNNGDVICDTDIDTTYTVGSGLLLGGGELSADFGVGSTQVATGNHAHSGTYLPIGNTLSCAGSQKMIGLNSNGNVTCGNDVDTNTTYTAGTGLSLAGTTFSALFGTTSGTVAAGNHNHSASAITSGTLSTSRYDSYSDLSMSGRLDNSSSSDLLTRSQGDTRWGLAASPTLSCITTAEKQLLVPAGGAYQVLSNACPSGYIVTGGGCYTGSTTGSIYRSDPLSSTTWRCYIKNNTASSVTAKAWARCCRLQ